jgi:hypothetical protein
VVPRSDDLKAPPGGVLPAHVRQIRFTARDSPRLKRRKLHTTQAALPQEMRPDGGEVLGLIHGQTTHEPRFARVRAWEYGA